ncbi:MAG: hypothetical protein RI575_00895 [Balneolaceae bacterium]|nr:hypothetical protein [Balneolaceae bacterium]MDR9407240.1 hypothetical protein [Balneolaceae bacterium]
MSEFNEESSFGNDEEPEIWDEFQWEEFMREADKRTEKYSQLFEKYLDHPDRDNIIAKEMGWDHLLDETEDDDKWDEFLDVDFIEEGEEWKQSTDFESYEINSLENLPVYQLAYEFSIDCINLIENRFENENDESIHLFARSVIIPPAKIAGGFGMGFELESLGGNIANCKRGLNAANRMLKALQQLRNKDLLDRETFQDFYERGKEVRDHLGIYIVELRERFKRRIP